MNSPDAFPAHASPRSAKGIAPLAGALALATAAVGLGLMVSRGHGLVFLALLLLFVVFASPIQKPAASTIILVGVVLLPTPAIAASRFHGIPPTTALGVVTFGASALLWSHQRLRVPNLTLSPYAGLGLLVILAAATLQLVFSRYAQPVNSYQLSLFWAAGLLLGSVLASDRRTTGQVGLLALPLALLALVELALNRPNLWGDIVGAHLYESTATYGNQLRATSTFGHPVVAGVALIIMAFVAFTYPSRFRTLLFSVIVAGAVATVSRSALVGLAVGLLVCFAGARHRRVQTIASVFATAAMVWLVINLIPALRTSFTARVQGSSTHAERVRLNSLHTLEASLAHGEAAVFTGRGLGGSIDYLAQTGGNLGFAVYDNQYVTSIYDSGILVVLLVTCLIVAGIRRARPGWRLLSPLAASVAAFFFFDGLYWPVTGFLFWLTVGLATTRRAAPEGLTA
jgi:hypothetical protein